MKGQHYFFSQYRIFIGSCMMALLSFPFFSNTFLQYVRKEIIRKEVKARILLGIPEDQLVHFHFHKAEMAGKIHWVEENEFEMGGHMYDVVSTKASADSIFFICWPDQKESAIRNLWKEQSRHVLSRDPQKQQHRKRVLEFEKSLFFIAVDDWRKAGDSDYYPTKVSVFQIPDSHIPGQPEPPPRPIG